MALDEAHKSLLGFLCLKTLFFSFIFLYSFGSFSLLLVFSFGFFLNFDSFSKKSGKFLKTGSAGSVIGLLNPSSLLTTQPLTDSTLGFTSPFNILISFVSGVAPSLRLWLTSAFNLGVIPFTRFGVNLFKLLVSFSGRVPTGLGSDLLIFNLKFEVSESGDAVGLSGTSCNSRPTGRGITSEVKEENWRGVGGGECGGGDREGLWGVEVLYGRERSQLEREAPGSKRLSTAPSLCSPELGANEDPMIDISPSPIKISFSSIRQ